MHLVISHEFVVKLPSADTPPALNTLKLVDNLLLNRAAAKRRFFLLILSFNQHLLLVVSRKRICNCAER